MGMRAQIVEWITGGPPADTCDRWAVCGTDLGIMWDAGNGTVLTLFGDTYAWPNPKPGGTDWRNNVIGACRDTDLSDGMNLTWMATDREGHARQIIPRDSRQAKEETVIPTSGVSVGPHNYITYMSVKEWNEPGHWKTNYAGLALSEDYGTTWAKPDGSRWFNNGSFDQPFQMCALFHEGNYVYLLGTQNGRFGPVKLARVNENKVMDLTQHEQWDGTTWVKNPAAAVEIIPAPVGECSIIWHEATGQYLFAYTDNVARTIAVRTAQQLTGPWSEPYHVLNANQFAGLYGGFFHPWSRGWDAPYLAVSQWVPTYQSCLFRLDIGEGVTTPGPAT